MQQTTNKSFLGITPKGWVIGGIGWSCYLFINAIAVAIHAGIVFYYAFLSGLMEVGIEALLSIVLWNIALRIQNWSGKKKVALNLALAFLLAAFGVGLYFTIFIGIWGIDIFYSAEYNRNWLFITLAKVGEFAALSGIFHLILSQRRMQEQEKRAIEMQLYAQKMELIALKAQLNPHFLFNSLNAINALIGISSEKARETLVKLSEVLRYALDSDRSDYVPLSDEIAFVKTYLDIEKARFTDRLTIRYEIDDAALSLMIPPMVLQPLVENAVKHGISKCENGGTILLRTSFHPESIRFMIANTGKPCEQDISSVLSNGGRGLNHTNLRLKKIFGDASALLLKQNGEWFEVSFTIPALTVEKALSNQELEKVSI